MTDESTITLQPGTVIAGRYEVVKCLGAGSMGMVYACRHRELGGHVVAVKVLYPEVARDRVAAQRFKNEIFASYGVSHPHVVRAYEYLRDGDLIAYTMEFVGGGDLAGKVSDAPNGLPIVEIVRLLLEMCAGVQAIHDAGIVHRDLKPENILLTPEGSVRIADFGIARTGYGPKLTETGGVVGTLDYVSPEYLVNSQIDFRSDIYALGVLAYEMVTGDLPFMEDTVYSTMTRRLKEDPVPARVVRADCPQILSDIVQRAMVRDPEQRFQTASEIFDELEKLQRQLGIATGKVRSVARPSSGSGISGAGTASEDRERPRDGGTASQDTTQSLAAAAELLGGQWQQTVITDVFAAARGVKPNTQNAQEALTEPVVDRAPLYPEGSGVEPFHGAQSSRLEEDGYYVQDDTAEIFDEQDGEPIGSWVVDLIIILVAVMIGIGVGFALLTRFFPTLVAP